MFSTFILIIIDALRFMNKKTIIVPTDFSENALYAATYACQLAKQNKYNLHLFHCYTSKTVMVDDETADEDNKILKADVLIEELKESLERQFSNVTISTECRTGLLTEVLPEYAIEPNFSLIVMGTTGAGSQKNISWGSNTNQISSKSTIPVLAIPFGYSDFSFKKIAILSNFKTEELDTIKEFINLVSDIENLDVIHIYKDNTKENDVEEQLNLWSFNIKHLNGIGNVNTISAFTDQHDEALDTVPEVINHCINQGNYDLVLVTKTRKSFFERLFKNSISKEVALDLRRPTFFDKI